jgi:membrane protease YdiL (CAAX protease family)
MKILREIWQTHMEYIRLVLRVCGVLALLFAFNIPFLIFVPEGIHDYLYQLFFIFATLIFAFGIDGMKFKDMGLELRGRGAEFGFGLGLGTIQVFGIFLIYWILDTLYIFGVSFFDYFFPALIYFTLVAVAEEMFFRGYLLNLFSGSIYKALIISALLFAVGHPIDSGFDFILLTLKGIAYGYMYLWSGSLWLPMGAHLTWNLALKVVKANSVIVSSDTTA